jgi:pimeloyl-ACP methyl ester carboxylesterase
VRTLPLLVQKATHGGYFQVMHQMEQALKFSRFGSENGRPVIYFHGAPGAPEECSIFERYAKEQGLTFICFDRFSVGSLIDGEAYYRFLAREISKQAAGKEVDVIGFSIGAFIALQTCRHMGNRVRNLHLISAAAPLETGDFLDAMTGKQVFYLAKTFPVLFRLLSYFQGLLAILVPNALFRLLFACTAGEDNVLAADREFQTAIIKLLQSCFSIGRVFGYVRDIRAYVQPWQATLSEVSVNTHIWHGAEDNWSPKSMADYLQSAIPGCSHIEILEGQSHYSCLYKTAPLICRQLKDA